MQRDIAVQLCERQALEIAARLFGTSKTALGKFDDYEGCANLVYHYLSEGQPRVLRLSYNPDRPVEIIQAELHFVEYLAEGGAPVSRPVLSINGNLIEVIPVGEIPKITMKKRLRIQGIRDQVRKSNPTIPEP